MDVCISRYGIPHYRTYHGIVLGLSANGVLQSNPLVLVPHVVFLSWLQCWSGGISNFQTHPDQCHVPWTSGTLAATRKGRTVMKRFFLEHLIICHASVRKKRLLMRISTGKTYVCLFLWPANQQNRFVRSISRFGEMNLLGMTFEVSIRMQSCAGFRKGPGWPPGSPSDGGFQ